MIELAAAVVGDPQHVDAVRKRQYGIFGRLNALDDQRHTGERANPVEHVPVQRGLKILTARVAPALRDEALQFLPLAIAVDRGVGRDDERAITGWSRARSTISRIQSISPRM